VGYGSQYCVLYCDTEATAQPITEEAGHMAEQDAGAVLEVAKTADACTNAVRAADFGVLDSLLAGSPHRAQLVATWARLLVTVVPAKLAAEMVDELWRHDNGAWLIAVEHFLDYANQGDPGSLDRFIGEVLSWPGEQQSAFARVVFTTVAKSLPDNIVPSHYLVTRGLIIEAVEETGCAELTNALVGLVALGWQDTRFPALRLAFELARHVDRELPDTRSRRRAVTVLALVLSRDRRAGEPVAVTLRGPRMVTDADDPGREFGHAEKATVVAARAVRHAGRGRPDRIEAELAEQVPGEHDLVSVLLALALATAAHVRDEAGPARHGL
jgi:hypothetical protein